MPSRRYPGSLAARPGFAGAVYRYFQRSRAADYLCLFAVFAAWILVSPQNARVLLLLLSGMWQSMADHHRLRALDSILCHARPPRVFSR